MEQQKTNKRFIFPERVLIEKYAKEGHSSYKISMAINRSQSGTEKEIKRGGGINNYSADIAQKACNLGIQNQIAYLNKGNGKSIREQIEEMQMQIEVLHVTIKEMKDAKG